MRRFWIEFLAALPWGDTSVIILDGVAHVRRGKPRSILVAEISGLAKEHRIAFGCIQAMTGQNGCRLRFFGIPDHLHQRFRNVWAASWR